MSKIMVAALMATLSTAPQSVQDMSEQMEPVTVTRTAEPRTGTTRSQQPELPVVTLPPTQRSVESDSESSYSDTVEEIISVDNGSDSTYIPGTIPGVSLELEQRFDRLSECESGGDWSINTGNGYHGGLQFYPPTWNAYGGQEFAPYAYQATREEQMQVAKKVLDGQGWGAWPACTASFGWR